VLFIDDQVVFLFLAFLVFAHLRLLSEVEQRLRL
jgi:Na+-transporting methylmalonyl-CoA/oxaloacetate decarboxylase gamma subunit